MTKTEFPEGFFEKPRPHATNLYIAKEHETEDGDYIELVKKLILCKDCKHFSYDVVGLVDGIPLIVGHEMCDFWGDGCKTSENGWCSYAERREE